MEETELVLEQGKIYYLDYGSNTQIIGRYKDSDTCNHNFYDLLHYWNGYESFRHSNQYCVKSGIETIRRASKSEIHNLVKHEIEQIWEARKIEIQNDLNDTVNMHIELIRGV